MQPKPCFYKLCTGLARANKPYCSVHDLEKVMARVRVVVLNNFAPAIASRPVLEETLRKLQKDILQDIEDTV